MRIIPLPLLLAAACGLALAACKKQSTEAKQLSPAADSSVAADASSAERSGDAVELKARWPADARFKQRMELAQNSETIVPNMPMPMKTSTTMSQDTSLHVLREFERGGREIEMSIDDMSMSVFQGDREIFGFDSKGETVDGGNPAAEAFRSLVGGKVRFLLDSSNRVEKVEGVQPLLEGLTAKLKGPERSVLGGMFNEDYFKQMGDFGHTLPGRAVRPGEHWPSKTEISAGPMGRMTLNLEHSFKGWEQRAGRRAAQIDFVGSISSQAQSGTGPGGLSIFIDDGKISGKSWFDPERGQMIESSIDQEMTVRMGIPARPGAPSGPVSITNRMNQKISLKLSPAGA
jgi:Family of unknown function (DUF6263)